VFGMTTSIHDHRIRELTISAAERTIRLVTGYPEIAGPQQAEAIFNGVEAYVFNGDALGTILFDIEVVDALMLYREWAVQLQAAYTQTGGHAPWVANERDAVAFLSNGDLHASRVSSSIGLEGAVWARKLTIGELGR
jgi:hypothetical protein